MDRLQQKDDLTFKLGKLFGPLQDLVAHPERYNEQEKARVLAQYFAEWWPFRAEFQKYTQSEPGYKYRIQDAQFYAALVQLEQSLIHQNQPLSQLLAVTIPKLQAAINAVPVPDTSVILEAGTPFTTYCKLKSLCEANANEDLIWVDPYVSSNIFHRYLDAVHTTVAVTLVVSEPGVRAGTTNRDRWTEFLDISRLFAQERGPNRYRLLVHADLHDRWVLFDEKRLYNLGGSSKDAANKDYFTIAALESSPPNLQAVQNHINNAIEYFGPNVQTHQ